MSTVRLVVAFARANIRPLFNVIILIAAGAIIRVRIKARQLFIGKRLYGLLERLRGQGFRSGQVEAALNRRTETGYGPHELPRVVDEIAAR